MVAHEKRIETDFRVKKRLFLGDEKGLVLVKIYLCGIIVYFGALAYFVAVFGEF